MIYEFESNRLSVRNKKTKKEIAWQPPDGSGYCRISLVDDSGITRKLQLNRLVACTYHGKPPQAKLVVAHLNNDKTDNSPANLAFMTCAENTQNAIGDGLVPGTINEKKVEAILITEFLFGEPAAIFIGTARGRLSKDQVKRLLAKKSYSWIKLTKEKILEFIKTDDYISDDKKSLLQAAFQLPDEHANLMTQVITKFQDVLEESKNREWGLHNKIREQEEEIAKLQETIHYIRKCVGATLPGPQEEIQNLESPSENISAANAQNQGNPNTSQDWVPTFQEELKEYLKSQKLTQLDFAKKVDVSASLISRWLKGEHRPGPESIEKLKALGFKCFDQVTSKEPV